MATAFKTAFCFSSAWALSSQYGTRKIRSSRLAFQIAISSWVSSRFFLHPAASGILFVVMCPFLIVSAVCVANELFRHSTWNPEREKLLGGGRLRCTVSRLSRRISI